MNKFKCKMCGIEYDRQSRVDKHTNSPMCKKIQKAIKISERKISRKYQKKISLLEKTNNSLQLKAAMNHKKELSRYLKLTQEKKNLQTDKKTQTDLQPTNRIPFGKEIYSEMVQMDDVRKNLGLMVEGDVELFRKIYIEDIDSENISIKLNDFARRKFSIWSSEGKWETCHLRRIVNVYAKKIRSMYDRVILEKSSEEEKVRADHQDDIVTLNVEIALLHQRYQDKTKHWGLFNTKNQTYLNKLGVGILDLLSKYKT